MNSVRRSGHVDTFHPTKIYLTTLLNDIHHGRTKLPSFSGIGVRPTITSWVCWVRLERETRSVQRHLPRTTRGWDSPIAASMGHRPRKARRRSLII